MDAVDKPFLRALAGEAVWPPPIWLMRQAGRYLPEYRATKEKAGGFLELCLNPALSAEVTFQPLRRFPLDAAILFTDLPMLPWAMGQGLRYGQGGADGVGPILDPVRDAAAIEALTPGRAAQKAAPIMETVRRIRAGLEKDHPGVALIGFAGAPWTVACYMVDGRGGHGFPLARHMAEENPALLGRLFERLLEASEEYLVAQAEAGAEALMLFDSWAGLLPPEGFERWVVQPTAELVRRLRARLGPDYPLIGFPRLGGEGIPAYAGRVGVNAVGLDETLDPAWAAGAMPPGVTLQGNLDSKVLVAGGAALEEATASILSAMKGRPFIFNLGHGITPDTPIEHVAALVAQVKAAQVKATR
ncbi:uroporphyrinogen decarboxylase [Roseomonas sp. SSH11]|uniref:Uroporphyrinogen decarboxylase n=1 Tax=Pararoseomonas baculiformis TaxID=2820812 RepID=A0ABS4AD14_9PROT|nr:uroporphyrinogen decarboxylase [Pararoseomonas baculiformis]MBP0444746.1 uroporphyrinogen decarboxylase [Pararoseomonas baculiformis]